MPRVHVTAKADYLDRLITTPRNGLLELIWNALDADAQTVQADLQHSVTGGVEALVVSDDGTGLSADSAATQFGALGGSWKQLTARSDGGRALHGKQGRGRFAAYGLGNEARWDTVADATEGRKRTFINGSRSSPDSFDIEYEDSIADQGTTVTVSDLPEGAIRYLESDRVVEHLTSALAIYVLQYQPKVRWRERAIDPASLIEEKTDFKVTVEHDGESIEVELSIIEWNARIDRALYLCDGNGLAIEQMPPGIQAPGFTFTAYARWDGFAKRPHDLLLGESAPEPIPTVISAVQDQMRQHFKQRTDDRFARLVEKWKEEDSYPFSVNKNVDQTPADEATQDLFDIVAFAAAPTVERADVRTRRLSLRLLKEAVQTSPDTLHHLLGEIIALPEDQAEELRDLIGKTSLTNVISASKLITNRLDFLMSLEAIINDQPLKKVFLERQQLHKILADEMWIFREEYAFVGNDETLRTVLKNHRNLLDDVSLDDEDLEADVEDEEGKVRVVDLMLSRVVEQGRSHREHLVVEIKRPSVHIGQGELGQIENYALMVAKDNRFAGVDARWEFWIVGDNMTDAVRLRANQVNHEPGVTMQLPAPRITVRVVTWAQVIQDARHRLRFVKNSLNYSPTTEAGLSYLRKEHAKYLPAEALEQQAIPSVDGDTVTKDAGSSKPDQAEVSEILG